MESNITIPMRSDDYGAMIVQPEILTGDFKSLGKVRFLVDTGAIVTIVAWDDLLGLGFTEKQLKEFPESKVKAKSAVGKRVNLQYITNMQFKFEEREVQGITVYFSKEISELSLLGTNFLKYFNLIVNYTQNKFVLNPRKDRVSITGDETSIKVYSLQSKPELLEPLTPSSVSW